MINVMLYFILHDIIIVVLWKWYLVNGYAYLLHAREIVRGKDAGKMPRIAGTLLIEKNAAAPRATNGWILITVNRTGSEINVKLRTRSISSDGGTGGCAGIKTTIKHYAPPVGKRNSAYNPKINYICIGCIVSQSSFARVYVHTRNAILAHVMYIYCAHINAEVVKICETNNNKKFAV